MPTAEKEKRGGTSSVHLITPSSGGKEGRRERALSAYDFLEKGEGSSSLASISEEKEKKKREGGKGGATIKHDCRERKKNKE